MVLSHASECLKPLCIDSNMLTPRPYVLLQRDRYRLRVRASDRGEPPSSADVDVELDVVDRNNKPPIWDLNMYGPIHIRENVTVGTVVTTVKARFVPPLQVSGQEKIKRVKRARGERAIVSGRKSAPTKAIGRIF
jgi:hypothetical protein